jgi:hypothetical protein
MTQPLPQLATDSTAWRVRMSWSPLLHNFRPRSFSTGSATPPTLLTREQRRPW